MQIKAEVEQLGVQEGFVNVLSRHTTTAIAINECEARLLDDIRQVDNRPADRPGHGCNAGMSVIDSSHLPINNLDPDPFSRAVPRS